MENYVANSFDTNYALAWSMDQGGFSSSLAQNLIQYFERNNLKPRSVLDLAFGTCEFLYKLSRQGLVCYGTEIAKSMVDYSKAKYPDFNLTLADHLYDIPFRDKFDLITCNHDMVNTLERFNEWQELFKNAYRSLNNGGMFVFDYYTQRKLENWNEVSYEEGENMDHITQTKKGMDNKCILNEIYYIRDPENKFTKTYDVQVEAYFPNIEIVEALKKAGFKEVELCNFSLEKAESPETRNRMHVIAKK